MLRTYKATIRNNQVQWENTSNELIKSDHPVPVLITLLDESFSEDKNERCRNIGMALNSLVQIHAFAHVKDPVSWQRESRQERRIPGREDAD